MFRPSRWSVAAAAVAVALSAARPVRAAEVDKLLPADTEGVVYVNVRQILDSELIKKYALEQIKQALAGNDAQKALTELGLDPLKDVDRVIAGGSGGGDPSQGKGLIIVRGRFDADKLYKAAEQASQKKGEKVTLVKEDGNTYLKIQTDNNPKPLYATVVDANTVVVGTDKSLAADAVAAAGGAKKGAVKPALTALVGTMDEKASMFVAAVVAGKAGNVPLPGVNDPAVQKNLEKLDNMTVTLRVTGDVNVDVSLGMKDATSADEFGKIVDQALQQAKGFLPLLAGDPKMKPLAELGKTLSSGVTGKDITITAKLSGDSIAKMLNPGE